MNNRPQIRKLIPFITGVVTVILVAIMGSSAVFQPWENNAFDLLSRKSAGRIAPDERIVIVAVTTDGMQRFTKDFQVLWPWPRDVWARLVEVAHERGARAVIFDMLFDDPGIDRNNSSALDTDLAFAAWLNRDFPVVTAAQLVPQLDDSLDCPSGLHWSGPTIAADDLAGYKLSLPHERFRKSRLGLSNTRVDNDGLIRRMPLLWHSDFGNLPGLALRAASFCPDFDLTNVPVTNDGNTLLRYYGPGGPVGPFPYIRAFDLIVGTTKEDLNGKILIVGAYAAGLLDYKPTPLASKTQPYPGLEIHATLLSNVLQNNGILPLTTWAQFLVSFLLGLICLALVDLAKSMAKVQILGIVALVISFLVTVWFAFQSGRLLPVIGPLLAIVLGTGAHFYVDWQLEGKQRKMLRNLFSHYLDTSVIDELLITPENAQLEGSERIITVMFADMVKFTTVSEKLKPAEVVSLLNLYYKEFVDIVLRRKGFLDKFIGDAVLTLFGVPTATADTQQLAASALLEIQTTLRQMNQERQGQGLPTIDINIGIHTDRVILGNIGHPRRMDYTAIGSGVNTASRLEGANRYTKTKNLVSEEFCQDLPASFRRREIGRIVLKGQSRPIRLYELIEEADDGPWVDRWTEAWQLWYSGDRQAAVNTWKTIQAQRPDDKAIPPFMRQREENVTTSGEDDDILILSKK